MSITETRIARRVHDVLDISERMLLAKLEGELAGCLSVLDLGCGVSSPLTRLSRDFRAVGLDAHLPAIEASRARGIHQEYIHADAANYDLGTNTFDAVLLFDVIEHLAPDEARALLDRVELAARQRVILLTPNGFIEQHEYASNPFQEHRSGWQVEDLERRGYRVYGINGWRPLRGDLSLARRPRVLNAPLSQATQPIVFRRPRLAYQLLGVRRVSTSGIRPAR